MKALLLSGLVMLLITSHALGQAGNDFQRFEKEGFRLKCNCKLASASDFVASARKQGRNVVGAYACTENEADAKKAVTIKINVTDESAGYGTIRADSIAYYNSRYLLYLAADMKKKGFTTTEVIHNGQAGLECRGVQESVPTILLIVLRNKRIYTLSVATKGNLDKQFERIRSSYQVL